MKKVLMFLCWIVCSMVIIGTPNAHADMLSVLFTDPSNAEVPSDGVFDTSVTPYKSLGDVSSVLLDFDTTTGDYTATWTAYAADPFQGDLDLILNLRDETIAAGTDVFAKLSIQVQDVAGATVLTYSGNDTELMNWSIGDEIVSEGTFGTGGIGSGGFGSMLHVTGTTYSGWTTRDDLWPTTSYVTASGVPEPVPVPGAFLLGMLGLGAAGVKLRRHA